jgi:thymidylate kinase
MRWNRRCNPLRPTPTVVLLGPDGSGKSTLSMRLTADLRKMGVDAGRVELGVYNGQTRFIRFLQRFNNLLMGYDLESDKSDRRAGALSLESRNGLLKSSLYLLDQVFRYVQANASGHDVLVADRYLHDVVLYHHLVFTRLLPWFDNEHVLPFVLDADSDVIAERSEYNRGSIDEMRKRLSILDSDKIDVSKSLAEIREDLQQQIAGSAFVKYLK